MSKRRKPGEIVRRQPGSGFCEGAEPNLVKVPEGKTYEGTCIKDETDEWVVNPGGEADYCILSCGDPDCREWANLEIINGEHAGEFMYHISECQMFDRKDCNERQN